MPVSELGTTSPDSRPVSIASRLHLIGLLLLLFGTAAAGFLAQHAAAAGAAPVGQLAEHSKAIRIYLVALFMDWAQSRWLHQ